MYAPYACTSTTPSTPRVARHLCEVLDGHRVLRVPVGADTGGVQRPTVAVDRDDVRVRVDDHSVARGEVDDVAQLLAARVPAEVVGEQREQLVGVAVL